MVISTQAQEMLQVIFTKLALTGKKNHLYNDELENFFEHTSAHAVRLIVEELENLKLLTIKKEMFGSYKVEVTIKAWEKMAAQYLDFDPLKNAETVKNSLSLFKGAVKGPEIATQTELTASQINIAIHILESQGSVWVNRNEHPVPEGYTFMSARII